MDEHTTIADLKRRLAAAEAALLNKAGIEAALTRSEELRRIAVEGGRMGTWRWNLRDGLIWGDAVFLELWGFPPSDEPRRVSDFTDRMSPQGLAEMGEMVPQAVAAGEEFDGQLAVVGGLTNGHWVRWRGRAERDQPWIVNGVSFDVTDQRLKDERLRESEARNRLLIGSWAQAEWETDAAGVVVADSPSWRAYTGQTLEEWLGYGWLDAIHRDDRAYAERQWREAITARALVNAEFRLRAPDGGWRWTNVRAAPVLDDDGNIARWAEMNIDIDARRRAEAALRESEERLRLTTELVPALLWTADPVGRDIAITDRWKLYTGQSEVAPQNDGWLGAVHPDDREATRTAFAQAFETGEPMECQQRIHQAGDGYRWHLIRHVPVRDGSGVIARWFGAAIDVHDLHELQDRQQILAGELQHRTRNLMGVVRAVFEDTLDAAGDLDIFVAEFRDRLDALVRVQRLLSRFNGDERITFDALIGDEMRAMGAPPDGGKITLEGPPGVALRSSTVQTFALAIHELATNAVKYGALKQPAGRLAVTWRLALASPDGQPWLHVDWRESGIAMPPASAAPQGTGQGRQLIEHALPYQLGAITTYVMAADGVQCTIAVPVSSRTAAEETDYDRTPPT